MLKIMLLFLIIFPAKSVALAAFLEEQFPDGNVEISQKRGINIMCLICFSLF